MRILDQLCVTICLFSSLLACSQKKTNQLNPTTMQTNEITADNIVEKIASQVKHYPQEPIYLIGYKNYYNYFEMSFNFSLKTGRIFTKWASTFY